MCPPPPCGSLSQSVPQPSSLPRHNPTQKSGKSWGCGALRDCSACINFISLAAAEPRRGTQPRGLETRGASVISCAERPGATPKLLPATRTHARAPEAAERAPGAHAGALKPSHALGDDQKNVECQIAAASGCGYLEHLECSHQPHIQGRGAKKRTQRAG